MTSINGHQMPKTDTLSIRLSPEMRTQLDFIAKSTRRSKSFLGSEAVARFIKTEAEIIRGIQEAQAEMKAGLVIPHDEAMQSMHAAIRNGAKRPKSV
jgi:RHH-type rel operon transcriptional repressor/antitoxin RelB